MRGVVRRVVRGVARGSEGVVVSCLVPDDVLSP